MNYKTYSFRFGEELLTTQTEFTSQWNEIHNIIDTLTDQEIINHFNSMKRNAKSISESLNKLFKEKFTNYGWKSESPIYKQKTTLKMELGV